MIFWSRVKWFKGPLLCCGICYAKVQWVGVYSLTGKSRSLWYQENFSTLASASKLVSAGLCEMPVSRQQAAVIKHFSHFDISDQEIILPWTWGRGLPIHLTIFWKNCSPHTPCSFILFAKLLLLFFCRAMHPLGLGQPHPLCFCFTSLQDHIQITP